MTERMTDIKQWLEQALYADARIKALTEQVKLIEARLERGRMSSLTGMPRGGGGDWTDQVSRVVMLSDEIARLERTKAEIHAVILRLKDPGHVAVMELRYISGYTWPDIARRINCDERTAQRWHGRALQRLAELGIGTKKAPE